jgi:two-component system LytT family response regulator
MSTIRALIVDDERLARVGVRRELEKYPAIEIVGECANGLEAMRSIRTLRPSLVFLDIQMPGLDGFEVIQRIGIHRMPPVVFVTAFDEYAIRAFEVHAFDYLLKPIDPARFHETLEHTVARLRGDRDAAIDGRLEALLAGIERNRSGAGDDRLVVRERDRIFFVPADRVLWVESAGNYVRLHLDRACHLLRATMDRMEERLTRHGFVRVRRSALVNLSAVTEIQPLVKGTYVFALRNGARVLSSRGYRPRVESLLEAGR